MVRRSKMLMMANFFPDQGKFLDSVDFTYALVLRLCFVRDGLTMRCISGDRTGGRIAKARECGMRVGRSEEEKGKRALLK